MNEVAAYENGKASDVELVNRIIRRWDVSKAERATWLPLWQEMSRYVRPSTDPVLRSSTVQQTPSLTGFEQLYDSTAIHANMVLASGTMAQLTPAQSPWFAFDAPRSFGNADRVTRWYDACTIIAHEALATSNFYTELHNGYLDRGAFGTTCFHADTGGKHPLQFRCNEVGTFALMDGADGVTDTVFRELQYDARQAAQEYGEANLPQEMRDQLTASTSDAVLVKHQFLHVIYPRTDAERDGTKMDARNMPVASVHIHLKSRCIVRNSGYAEMSSFGSRYLRWGNASYGFCPAWMALPDCRQLNELQRNMDVLAEVAAFPRMLIPEDLEGQIDLRANGITYFKSQDRLPKEWATQGKYDIGMDRVKMRREDINKAFHVELFQQWAALTKQMTAAEVAARSQEKIELFSPTFTLLTTELYGPMLRRVFSLLLRQGVFPPPPPEAVYLNNSGRYAVSDPQIRYTSRLALALKAVRSYALNNAISRVGAMSAFAPGVGDNINWDRTFRDSVMDDGLPVEWIADEEDVQKMRQAKQAAAQQQQQIAMAHQAADSASKLASSGLIQTQTQQQ